MNTTEKMDIERSRAVYAALFEPDSIAVIGGSNDVLKPGGRVTTNIKDNGYSGELWAVNPKTPVVLDLPTYRTIDDLPHGPDLAIVAIPSPFVVEAIRALAARNTKAVIVLTSGFGEKNEKGKEIEYEMVRIANETGMCLIGPNCSGFLTKRYKGKFAGIIPRLPGKAVDFISGSGATVDYVMEYATTRGLSFGNVVNLGNSAQMGVEDLLELYDENYGDGSASIVMLYLEAVKKPKKLLRHATSLAQKGCTLVGIKSGVSEAGKRAAASHTGAIASSDTAVEALFKKAGIIRVTHRAALVDVACVLQATNGALRGKRACIVTDAGGPGVMLSDEMSRQGFELTELKEETQILLSSVLPSEASLVNPVDALPSRSASQITEILRILNECEKDNIDIVTVLLGDSGMSDNAPIYETIAEAMVSSTLPVIPMFSSLVTSSAKIEQFSSRGQIFFSDEVALAKALGRVSRKTIPKPGPSFHNWYDTKKIQSILEGHSGALQPATVSQLLLAAGFRLPYQAEIFTSNRLVQECGNILFPLAMKVIGPLHKSDVGGVKLGLNNLLEATGAWEELMQIPGAEGVVIQPMISGIEVIAGTLREGDFGQLVMFGLGGIYTEVFEDVNFSLAPLSARESREMVVGINSFPIIKGIRGEEGMDVDLLIENLQRLNCLVTDFPQIQEIDLNPIKGTGRDLYVVDARIIVD